MQTSGEDITAADELARSQFPAVSMYQLESWAGDTHLIGWSPAGGHQIVGHSQGVHLRVTVHSSTSLTVEKLVRRAHKDSLLRRGGAPYTATNTGLVDHASIERVNVSGAAVNFLCWTEAGGRRLLAGRVGETSVAIATEDSDVISLREVAEIEPLLAGRRARLAG